MTEWGMMEGAGRRAPELGMFGSLHLRELITGVGPHDPVYWALGGPSGLAILPFGQSKFMQRRPDLITKDRARADAVRGIGQTDVATLDQSTLVERSLSPTERGLWSSADYRVPHVETMGADQLRNDAALESVAYLLDVIELVALNGGAAPVSTGINTGGLNVTTALGTADDEEVTRKDVASDPWTSEDADILGQLQDQIEAHHTTLGVWPNTLIQTSVAWHRVAKNRSIQSLFDDVMSLTEAKSRIANLLLTQHYSLRSPKVGGGLSDDVSILCYQRGMPGGDPRARGSYYPFVVGATNEIDRRGMGDYAMGAGPVELAGAPPLASVIGYRTAVAEAGSIEKVRAACNFDTFTDTRGLARIIQTAGTR